MKTPKLCLALSLLLLTGALSSPAGAASTSQSTVVADPFIATFPATCAGPPVATGLCLLGSTVPNTTDVFLAQGGVKGNQSETEYTVNLNTLTYLPPGNYRLYRKDGLDFNHETTFSVQENQIITLKTATIKFQDSAGKYNKLQHFQTRDGINGVGCQALVGVKGTQAFLPGNYFVSTVATLTNSTPKCEHNGTAFNIMAGTGATIRPVTVTEQLPAPRNIYPSSPRGVSLTTIDPGRYDVRDIAFVSKLQRYKGIQNPTSAATDALVLNAAPYFHFAIPMTMNTTASCGISKPGGGIPPHNLLTDCVFDQDGYLTRFRVNSGSYYGFNDVSGKSGVASHTINSPFIVSGVKFNLKGNQP